MQKPGLVDRILERGAEGGLESLRGKERLVWLLSECEVICDLEGMDSFLAHYGEHLDEVALAFERAGAPAIAEALRAGRSHEALELVRGRRYRVERLL